MKEDQEQKIHVCRFCKQSFSNGKKLGGHMRGHLALISATRKKGTQEYDQEAINGEKGVHAYDDDDYYHVIKKSQGIDRNYHVNGRKQGIQEHDREVINGGKGFDEDDDELLKTTQNGFDIDEDYDANGRKQRIQEHDPEVVNGGNGLDSDDDNDENKSQQEIDFDQDYAANVYVLRENPKRSWRVSNSNSNSNSNSSKALASHKRCQSRKESIKNCVCEKCGKGFDSVKALYGHMRCHSIKKSQPLDESSALSSSEEHEHEHDDEVANPVRKKRSCTRYKSPKPNHLSTSLSSFNDDEVEEAALNLMMLSKGVRNLDGVKIVISHGYSRNVGVDVSDDGSMEFCKFKNNSEMGFKKDLGIGSGSGQVNMGRVGSTLVVCKSTKKQISTDQDFTDSEMSIELKRRSKDYKCPICLKGYVSIQGLARHKGVHNKIESKVIESDYIPDIHRIVDLNLREVSTSTM